MKFSEIGLSNNLLKTLEKKGYEDMTPVQEATYPVISEGKDLCALAETGSGKTAACIIPLIKKIDISIKHVQVLVIVPTRELCIQYSDEISKLSSFSGIKPFSIYGGFCKNVQITKLNHCVHFLVATPGRLIDLLYDKKMDLSHLKCVILDEADELLNAGFLQDTEFILSCIIHKHQTLLFSATMSKDIKKLTSDYLKEPVHIDLIKKRTLPKTINHYFNCVPFPKWQDKLIDYIKEEEFTQMMIFCDSRSQVENVFRLLKRNVDDVEYIHAGLNQDKRSSILNRFKRKKIRCLIATDVAGRGLDFSNLSHVVNWGLPRTGEQYAHRIGRVGRMGRQGKAMTFLGKRDLVTLKTVIRINKISPNWIGLNPLLNLKHGRVKVKEFIYKPNI